MYVDGAKNNPVVAAAVVLMLVLPLASSSLRIKRSIGEPSPEFDRHHRIEPELFHGVSGRSISHTKGNNASSKHHLDRVTAKIAVDGRELVLDLKLNRELIPDTFYERYHDQVGARFCTLRPTANTSIIDKVVLRPHSVSRSL